LRVSDLDAPGQTVSPRQFALPDHLCRQLQLSGIIGGRDAPEPARAAVAVRRNEIRSVEEIERFEPELDMCGAGQLKLLGRRVSMSCVSSSVPWPCPARSTPP